MPTVPQIQAAKDLLDTQPYDLNTSKLTAESQANLLIFLRKYVSDHSISGRYVGMADKLAAVFGIAAAQLQAVLTNVSDEGSKKAHLQGELDYLTQETIDNELKFALLVMFEPLADITMGTKPSNVAACIRAQYHTTGCRSIYGGACSCAERERTIC